jgi:hypothetical protein
MQTIETNILDYYQAQKKNLRQLKNTLVAYRQTDVTPAENKKKSGSLGPYSQQFIFFLTYERA